MPKRVVKNNRAAINFQVIGENPQHEKFRKPNSEKEQLNKILIVLNF